MFQVLARHAAGTLLLGAVLLSPQLAYATPVSDAQILFDEGRRLIQSGHASQACPKFEQSQALDPALGTLLNLADCYEKSGHLAAAWRRFVTAADQAQREGHSQPESVARSRAEKLASRLPAVVLRPTSPLVIPSSTQVRLDGVLVEARELSTPVPVDPGTHRVEATAPGYTAWSIQVETQLPGAPLVVEIPALVSATRPLSPPPPPPVAAGGISVQRGLAGAALSLGAVGVVAGSVFGLKSMSRHNEAEKACAPDCTPDGISLKSQARDAGNVSTVAFAVGVAGLAGGVALWLTEPRAASGRAPNVAGSAAALGITPTGLTLTGTW